MTKKDNVPDYDRSVFTINPALNKLPRPMSIEQAENHKKLEEMIERMKKVSTLKKLAEA